MIGIQSKNEIALTCTEVGLAEFPDLLFGTHGPSGVSYFDATVFLNKQEKPKQINQFFVQYQIPILALCEAYQKKRENVCKINQEGHYLIDSNFVYLFIAFVEPQFLGYVFDRINELFTNGMAISDTYLVSAARQRISTQILQQMIDYEKEHDK